MTIALSWGEWGGFYVKASRWKHLRFGWSGRVCVGWVALTWFPIEIDDLMEAYADEQPASDDARN